MILPLKFGTWGSNHLWTKSGQIQSNFRYKNLEYGIIETLRLYGRELWFGHMSRETFLYGHYLQSKRNLLRNLKTIDSVDLEQINAIAFSLYMTRLAQSQRWNYPVLFNRDPQGRIVQMNGRNRAFASLMVHENPWEHYPILFAQPPGFRTDDLIHQGTKIEDDRQLNEIFGLQYDDEPWEPRIYLDFSIVPYNDSLYCSLDYVGDGTVHDHDPKIAHTILDEYRSWRSSYTDPVPVAVYTQWPDLLIDTNKAWDVKIVGSSEGMLIDDRLGYAERAVHQYHNSPTHDQDHVLWVTQPRLIDLSDFLPWMDMTHSTYISADWKFLLYRKQAEYRNITINVSQQAG